MREEGAGSGKGVEGLVGVREGVREGMRVGVGMGVGVRLGLRAIRAVGVKGKGVGGGRREVRLSIRADGVGERILGVHLVTEVKVRGGDRTRRRGSKMSISV